MSVTGSEWDAALEIAVRFVLRFAVLYNAYTLHRPPAFREKALGVPNPLTMLEKKVS